MLRIDVTSVVRCLERDTLAPASNGMYAFFVFLVKMEMIVADYKDGFRDRLNFDAITGDYYFKHVCQSIHLADSRQCYLPKHTSVQMLHA